MDLVRARERIDKLLALADDQEGKPEGQTARRLALAIAHRYGVSVTSTRSVGRAPPGALAVPFHVQPDEVRRQEYRAWLLSALAEFAGCTSGANGGAGWVAGPRADRVVRVYAKLEGLLDKMHLRYWNARRFGNQPRHRIHREWWTTAVEAVEALLDDPDLGEGTEDTDLEEWSSVRRNVGWSVIRGMGPGLRGEVRALVTFGALPGPKEGQDGVA